MRNKFSYIIWLLLIIGLVLNTISTRYNTSALRAINNVLQNHKQAIEKEGEAILHLQVVKKDRVETEFDIDKTQERWIELDGYQRLEKYETLREKTISLWYYLFVKGGGIYFRELKDAEVAFVPVSLIRQNPIKDEQPIICKIIDDWSGGRYFDSSYDRIVAYGIEECKEQDKNVKRPNLQNSINTIIKKL